MSVATARLVAAGCGRNAAAASGQMGELVFCSASPAGEVEFVIASADGRVLQRLPAPPFTMATIAGLSPDGKSLAYFAGVHKGFQLFTVNRDGSSVRQFTSDFHMASDPVFSPDGKWIAFSGSRAGPLQIFISIPTVQVCAR